MLIRKHSISKLQTHASTMRFTRIAKLRVSIQYISLKKKLINSLRLVRHYYNKIENFFHAILSVKISIWRGANNERRVSSMNKRVRI